MAKRIIVAMPGCPRGTFVYLGVNGWGTTPIRTFESVVNAERFCSRVPVAFVIVK